MSKINQILNVLIGKKLRASTIIRYTGLKPSLVYPYLSKLYEQGRISRENDEPPYLYTARATPEVFLLNVYKKFNELKEMITNLKDSFKDNDREKFKENLKDALTFSLPNERAIEDLLKKRFNFQS